MRQSLVRDYENPKLPLETRAASLARRFPSLAQAKGLDPFTPELFGLWLEEEGQGTPAWHAGQLILSLVGSATPSSFDAIAAVRAWNADDRAVFAAWARTWQD